MGNRAILAGTATVEVDQWRYDELLHNEATLNLLVRYLKSQVKVDKMIMTFLGDVEDKQ